jgi:hypothetical protein
MITSSDLERERGREEKEREREREREREKELANSNGKVRNDNKQGPQFLQLLLAIVPREERFRHHSLHQCVCVCA